MDRWRDVVLWITGGLFVLAKYVFYLLDFSNGPILIIMHVALLMILCSTMSQFILEWLVYDDRVLLSSDMKFVWGVD